MAKVWETHNQSIRISNFKTYVPPILGGICEGKEYTTPLKSIQTPELWNSHDGVRGLYDRALKSSQYHRLKL